MWNSNLQKMAAFFVLTLLVNGCDFFRKKKCEWYMVPVPEHIQMVEDGWVSLCLRNYVLDRQKCYITAKIDLAEDMFGKPFRLADLDMDESVFPREIRNVKECTPEVK